MSIRIVYTANDRLARRRAVTLILPLLSFSLLTGCSADAKPPISSPGAAEASEASEISALTTELDAPWSIAFHGETTLLSERDSGRILEIDANGNQREAGNISAVSGVGEGGLLGIAVHERYLYAYFTAGEENRIERFTLTGAPGALELGEPQTILEGIPSASYHNGGRIAFGPDGMLYATVGDAGDSSVAQEKSSLSGKILRLTPEGKVPEDNPFENSPVYSYGHRNPQGIVWDAKGILYASEFGQNTSDELNIIKPGGNYGWPKVEGIASDDQYVDPIQQWDPAQASPSGMTIAGDSIWIANLRGELLREVPLRDTSTSIEHLAGEYGRLRDVVTAPDGSLLILTNNTDGRGTANNEDDRLLRMELG